MPNSHRDAHLVAGVLAKIGFQVSTRTDLTLSQSSEALRVFAEQAVSADWAVIYFVGHGLEINGHTYLAPVDVKIDNFRDIPYETSSLDEVVRSIARVKKLALLFIDVSRDNPFADQIKGRAFITSRAKSNELSGSYHGASTMVAYSAKHGQSTVKDTGENSYFAISVARHMQVPGLELSKLLRYVREDVLKRTDNRQEPFVYGSLPGEDLYFVPKP